jgi:hypothetical protein
MPDIIVVRKSLVALGDEIAFGLRHNDGSV